MTEAQQYMRRALELAALGQGQTGTNPMVGAVLVHEGRIIGEGYHHGYGQPHAEVMAVRSVTEPELLGEATLYVTLEPCAHYGKTPPCAELVCTVGIPRVVVATLDPFPEVAGRGIERLRRAGIEVTLGVLEAEAWALNAPFFTAHTLHRPFVTLKWAQSLDAFMDSPRQDRSLAPVTFSSPLQQRSVHAARMEHEAILVGYRTALLDDPQLSNRLWYGRSPLRVVLDPQLQLPPELRLFSDAGAPTLIVHLEAVRSRRREGLDAARLSYLALEGERIEPQQLLQRLYADYGIQSLLVEGGGATLQRFVDSGLYDALCIEISAQHLGEGVPAPRLPR